MSGQDRVPGAAHACPLCGAADVRRVVRLKTGNWVCDCRACANGHLWPPPAVTVADYALGRAGNDSLPLDEQEVHRSAARRLCAFVQRREPLAGKRLLELGCGFGCFLEQAAQAGAQVEGLEPDPARRQVCAARGLRVCEADAAAWSAAHAAQYDVVVMSHVLEHVPDPAALLHECRRLLKPSGRLCLAQPLHRAFLPHALGRRWYAWLPQQHYWHFTPEGLSRFLSTCGFARDDFLHTDSYYPDPSLRAIRRPKFFLACLVQSMVGRIGRCLRSGDQFYLSAHVTTV